MLHIKLPKGKTAEACKLAAKYHSDMHFAANNKFHADLEAWRKTGGNVSPPFAPPRDHKRTAERLESMGEACKHSTGDVYISHDLWEEIKGYYP